MKYPIFGVNVTLPAVNQFGYICVVSKIWGGGKNKLENITHPRIVQQIKGIINDNSNDYIIEAIELVNSGLVNICDELWVIHAEPEQQIKRLTENRHLSYEEACSRLKAQENHDWDEKKADRVIYSTEPIESMERQVFDALDQFYRSKQ